MGEWSFEAGMHEKAIKRAALQQWPSSSFGRAGKDLDFEVPTGKVWRVRLDQRRAPCHCLEGWQEHSTATVSVTRAQVEALP